MSENVSDASWKRESDARISLSGSWSLLLHAQRRHALLQELRTLDSPHRLHWDLRHIDALDSAGAGLLWRVWEQQLPEQLDCREDHRHWFSRLANAPLPERPDRHWWDEAIHRLSRNIVGVVRTTSGILLLIGQLMVNAGYCIRHPHEIPWREFSATIYHVGITSMLLLGCIGFLIGIVMTIQIGQDLQQFGAALMSIHIIGLAVLRELGPVICGLIVAGRSGSAITAGIAAMHLTGEYDALRAFGSSPSLRLALPRVAAALITVPLLVVWTDFAALIGSAVTAQTSLGIRYELFLARLPEQTQIVNFWIGLAKGGLFGITIAIIGCYFGMQARPDTADLSRKTTLSVLTSLSLILLFDASSGALLLDVGLF